MTKKTIDELSIEWYEKKFNQLPDDGEEQDFIMGFFENQEGKS